MAKYRKAIVAGIGIVALLVPQVAGAEGDLTLVVDGVIGVLTAFGVFQVPNKPVYPQTANVGRKVL